MKTATPPIPKLVRNSNKSPSSSSTKSDKHATHNSLVKGANPAGGKYGSKK